MSRRARTVLFLAAALGLAPMLLLAYLGMPHFGTPHHPYGTRAVAASLARRTDNAISSVNFDQRALDTLGEEFIFFASVLGVRVLMRPGRDEGDREHPGLTGDVRPGEILDATRLFGYLVLPVAVLIGWYVVVHGHLSPGGGFQGGIVLATALHLAYLTSDYRTLRRLRPVTFFEIGEVLGACAFVLVGLSALATGSAFLTNVLPLGTTGNLASAGTVPVLNTAVGVEVAAGTVLLLSAFFELAPVGEHHHAEGG